MNGAPTCHPPPLGRQPQRVITVRLPKTLHGRLKSEAYDRRQSLNQMCLDALQELVAPPATIPYIRDEIPF